MEEREREREKVGKSFVDTCNVPLITLILFD